jgi:hypothetical protein
LARPLDFRGRAAESRERQYVEWRERATAEIYAENRNAIATFRDEALAEVNAADAGNPHAWALAESAASHATEMLWRNKQNLVDIADSGKTGTFTDDERKAALHPRHQSDCGVHLWRGRVNAQAGAGLSR